MPASARGSDSGEARRRTFILEAALEMFSREGFEGASINEIARQNGISQALVHYHFKNKENLWRAAVDHGVGDMIHQLQDMMRDLQDADTLAQLKFFIRRYISLVSSRPALFHLIARESWRGTERSVWLTKNYLGPLHGMFIDLIKAGQRTGRIKPHLNPHNIAVLLGTASSQFIVNDQGYVSDYGLDTSTRELREQHASVVIEALFHGLMTDEARESEVVRKTQQEAMST